MLAYFWVFHLVNTLILLLLWRWLRLVVRARDAQARDLARMLTADIDRKIAALRKESP